MNMEKNPKNKEDINKIKTDFAGDTFSQISSTFEPMNMNSGHPTKLSRLS